MGLRGLYLVGSPSTNLDPANATAQPLDSKLVLGDLVRPPRRGGLCGHFFRVPWVSAAGSAFAKGYGTTSSVALQLALNGRPYRYRFPLCRKSANSS